MSLFLYMVLESVLVSFFTGSWPLVKEIVQHHLLKTLSFLPCIFLPPLSKTGIHRCLGLSLGFLFCSTDLYFHICASTILSWWLWLCSIVWSQAGWFFQVHSSFSRLLCLFKVFLYFHTYCKIICSSSLKITVGSLTGIALNL